MAHASFAAVLLACSVLPACESTTPRDQSAIDLRGLIAAARAKLYRPADAGLVDLRAHFAVQVTAEPRDPAARDVLVGGEFLWRAPDQMRVDPSEDPVHAAEAVLTFDAYQGFLNSSAVDIPLSGLARAGLKLRADGLIESHPQGDAASACLGFERVKRVLLHLDEDGLPERIAIQGQLNADARHEQWPSEHVETFAYQRVGDRFALARVTSTMPSGLWEVTAELREVQGFELPVRLEFVIRPLPPEPDDGRRGRITLALDAICVNTGIDPSAFAQHE